MSLVPVLTSDFAAAFVSFLNSVNALAPATPNPFARRVVEHFGTEELSLLSVVDRTYKPRDRTTFEIALLAVVNARGRQNELIGVAPPYSFMDAPTFADLVEQAPAGQPAVTLAPVERLATPLPDGGTLDCIKAGVYLVSGPDGERFVAMVGKRDTGVDKSLAVSFVTRRPEEARALIVELEATLSERWVYRGHVLSLDDSDDGGVTYHRFPLVKRGDIIVPERVLKVVERQIVGLERHAARLARPTHHRRRGVLLYGHPGTGKTLIAKYLSRRVPGLTAFFVAGGGMCQLVDTCRLARELQPSLVVLEDVDLIASERTFNDHRGLLFHLLDQMDGVGEDADVTFLLTTNRPETLEPALAARPGRVDTAIEVPLPDASARARLIDLYAEGLDCKIEDRDAVVRRTDGVSAAFVRELVRRAALLSAEETEADPVAMRDRHFHAALDEIFTGSGPLTKRLLGFHGPTAA